MDNPEILNQEIYIYLLLLKEIGKTYINNENIVLDIKEYFNRDISLQEIRRYFSKIEIKPLSTVEVEELSLTNNGY